MAHYQQLHDWDLSPREAIQVQQSLRERVLIQPLDREIETIAGCDISFNKYSTTLYAGIVVLRLATLETIEEVSAVGETQFPYVPGLLSFREAPALLEAWAKLQTEPDAVMFDGQGLAHQEQSAAGVYFAGTSHRSEWRHRPHVALRRRLSRAGTDAPSASAG
jgi:deoxyribonuclease V